MNTLTKFPNIKMVRIHRIVSLHRASLRQVAPLEFPQGGNAARGRGLSTVI